MTGRSASCENIGFGNRFCLASTCVEGSVVFLLPTLGNSYAPRRGIHFAAVEDGRSLRCESNCGV
jgi:hypothetical protein